MSADRLPGALLPLLYLFALLVVSAAGLVWVVCQERRDPSAYSRRPEVLESWRAMSSAEQEAHDTAVLDAAEAAELAAGEAAERAVEDAARSGSLYR
ncbi:hypothetical protein ACFYQT_39845 [Streptomyces tibetensis]|uniref:Secreted protein n=1 Tax=Streptomyces tibetensis TaxID=2382123 RepID=A0ABW6N8C1_9ACTN